MPYNPAIPLLGIHIKETRTETDTCTPMFITASIWKTLSISRLMVRKLWYICTMEYYSALKRNASESALMRWMNLAPIIQSEVSQKEKRLILYIYYIYYTCIYGI